MSEETPSVEEIKSRLKIEVEEEPVKDETKVDVAGELKNLGRQFAQTLQSAWNSEERLRIEKEVREGLQSFVGEVDRVFNEAKESQVVERVKTEATQAKTKVDSTDIGQRARTGMAQGLHWLSEELAKVAHKFTPPPEGETAVAEEKSPDETE